MRLLHISTFKLESFFGQDCPAYAILSHTWGDEEITLQEIQQEDSILLLSSLKTRISKGQLPQSIQGIKKGFAKIVGCAMQAEKDGLEYIWCDTCCIDKTSSAELSEAINSMYHWYKDQLCYAYLADVPYSPNQMSLDREWAFARSRWFTRGWTLQELIAPSSVVFFDKTWQVMGTRSDFRDLISDITSIDRGVLDGEDPGSLSIAKRMSWASKRETTRIEDIAYCLMGLFGVNMPLLYGERERAFIRLQEEIMKISEDHSLFAWTTPISQSDKHCGLLASSPAYFLKSHNIFPLLRDENRGPRHQALYFMTNRGISISLEILQLPNFFHGFPTFFATLDCQYTTDARSPLGIFLYRNEQGNYKRCHLDNLIPASTILNDNGSITTKNIYVQQYDSAPKPQSNSAYQFHLPGLPTELKQHGIFFKVYPNKLAAFWDSNASILSCSRGLGAAIYIGRADGNGLILLIGIDPQLHARCSFDEEFTLGRRFIREREKSMKWYYNQPNQLGVNLVPLFVVPKMLQIVFFDQYTKSWDPVQQQQLLDSDFAFQATQEWDRWISGNFVQREQQKLPARSSFTPRTFAYVKQKERTSAIIYLETRVEPQGAEVFESTPEIDTVHEFDVGISVVIEEEIVKGRKMFSLQFREKKPEDIPRNDDGN